MKVETLEDRLLSQLKKLVDETSNELQWGRLTVADALDLIQQTHVRAEKLIPNQMELYRLIYTSRFQRLLEQFVLPRQLESQFNWHKPY